MRKTAVAGAACAAALAALLAAVAHHRTEAADKADKAGPMIVHDVYFTLKDNSADSKKKLVDACKKYLTKHPGEVAFCAGARADDFKRDINDQDFDVALHIVFKDKAAHDEYQDAKRHTEFIAENKDNWKKVRVFDSVTEGVEK
jgi:hypothetical protein